MGVHGMTTFVEGNTHFLQDVKVKNCILVIDGSSLYHVLYFNSGLDLQHGGDYDGFARRVISFISALTACNIQPYVVMDGGIDPSEKKLSTLQQRVLSKIKDADKLCHGSNGHVVPILTKKVFMQTLVQKRVPVVQCPAEADLEIACLAHHWTCPVLANDSDYYIFDLPGGYLSLNSFDWTNLRGKADNRFISAQRYTTNSLCRWFGGLNPQLLPLCAILTGNDYGTPKAAETLLALIDVNQSGRGGGRGRGGASSSRIEVLLRWLSSFSSPAEALKEISILMGEGGGRGYRGKKGGLSAQLQAGMREYHIAPQSSLAHWFCGEMTAVVEPAYALGVVPQWLSEAAARGEISAFLMDALVLHKVLLLPQVENCKLPSSHCISSGIRQAIYGILQQRGPVSTPQGRGGGIRAQGRGGQGRGGQGRGGGSRGGGVTPAVNFEPAAGGASAQAQGSDAQFSVEEFDRIDLNLKKNQVEARPPTIPLYLDTLDQAPVALRFSLLLDVLGVKEAALAGLSLHLRLAVAVTGFWLREATPTPSQHVLQALVLCMVHGEVSRHNYSAVTHQRNAGPQYRCDVERDMCVALNRLREKSGHRRGLDIGAAHSLSQWQSCLWSIINLNQLLLLPLPEPYMSWLFSGTLVHGLLKCLKGGQAAESLLAGAPLSGQLYSTLLATVRKCSSKVHPPASASSSSSGAGRGKRGRGRKRRGARGGGRGVPGGGAQMNDMINRFNTLMSDEDYDDD